jgi:hypothetical protein
LAIEGVGRGRIVERMPQKRKKRLRLELGLLAPEISNLILTATYMENLLYLA